MKTDLPLKAYRYKDNKGRILFVHDGISGGKFWATYHRKENGSLERIRSSAMPVIEDHSRAQQALDEYASGRGFERLEPEQTDQLDPMVEYVELIAAKRQKKEEIDGLDEKIAALEDRIKEIFVEKGMQSANVKGYCIYLQRQIYPKQKVEREQIIEAFKGVGGDWGGLVNETYNTNTLKSLINEQVAAADAGEIETDADGLPILPPEIAAVIELTEHIDVKARKA